MIRRTYFIYSILIYLFCFNYHIFSKSKRKKPNPAPAHYNIYTILTIHFMICYNCHALFIYIYIYGIFIYRYLLFYFFSKTQLIRPARIITITPRPVCMYPARIIPACRYSSNPAPPRVCNCVPLLYLYIYMI